MADANTAYILGGKRVVDVLHRAVMVKSGRVNAQTAPAARTPRRKIRRGRMGASILG